MLALLLLLTGAWAGDPERGALLAAVGGCESCHTAEGGAPYAGGYAIETRYGTFYGSNLTQDPEHGIGGWTLEDFVRAMRRGRSPEGRAYWPAFPYTSFTLLSDEDLEDLFAYLQGVAAAPTPDRPHETRGIYGWRLLLGPWRWLSFRRGPFEADPERSEAWNRGAYLVRGLGHCGECHTPRNGIGAVRDRRELAGTREPPEPGPNLTPHPDALGGWTHDDLVGFLEMGMTPEADFVGGVMRHLVVDGTARLSAEDRAAIADYLQSVDPVPPE